MSAPLRIIEPLSAVDLAAFDALSWEYLDFLRSIPELRPIVATFYPDAAYRAALARPCQRPTGLRRLMMRGDVAVGCGTVQTFAPDNTNTRDAEIKRVYIAPQARGTGAGRALMDQLVADCRAMGFARILMDTGKPLAAAQRLYDEMGFARRGPYQDIPAAALEKMVFFEMRLEPSP